MLRLRGAGYAQTKSSLAEFLTIRLIGNFSERQKDDFLAFTRNCFEKCWCRLIHEEVVNSNNLVTSPEDIPAFNTNKNKSSYPG